MKKIKIILILLVFIPFIVMGTYYSGYKFLGEDFNSDAGLTNNDIWFFGGDYIYLNEGDASALSGDTMATLSGVINTTLYGDFTFNNLDFIKDSLTNGCGLGKDTIYSFSGIVSSVEAWGNMSFTGASYYCPNSGEWTAKLYSDLLGYKDISSTGTLTGEEFNLEEKVFVKGVIGSNNAIDTGGDTIYGSPSADKSYVLPVSIDKMKINSSIDKNIELVTRGLTPINDLTSSFPDGVIDIGAGVVKINNLKTDESIYYLNYEGEEEFTASNEGNKGKVLRISNLPYTTSNFTGYQVGVKGKKTVIVKGGNVYIDADIYNVDNNSILVIVAKRDKTSINSKNGGNIYINPNVTNIDAVLIADGSIINYDGSNVITAKDSLRNQLYTYGSIYSRNSIGSPVNPYGSDGYIAHGKGSSVGKEKYDLTELRYFSLIPNDTSTDCSSTDPLLVPRFLSSDLSVKEYAWAGKRKCFNQVSNINPVTTNLRGSDLLNPLIVEYNSIINTNPPDVLKAK